MNRTLQGRVGKLEGGNGLPVNDEYFRVELRRLKSSLGFDVDVIPAGKAGAVYLAEIGKNVF